MPKITEVRWCCKRCPYHDTQSWRGVTEDPVLCTVEERTSEARERKKVGESTFQDRLRW